MKKIFRIFWKKYDGDLTQLSYEDYKTNFLDSGEGILKETYEKAWEARKFEIDLYWKRATYFWAFLIPAFAGYFAVLNSEQYSKADENGHPELFLIICIGFIVSIGWTLVNRGSKTWQRHWETHVDLLENALTGPLYKTVNARSTYSVSKINEIISWFFSVIWILLAVKYKEDQHFHTTIPFFQPTNWIVSLSAVSVCLFVLIMFKGYGRGHFSNRGFSMYKRNIKYINPDKTEVSL